MKCKVISKIEFALVLVLATRAKTFEVPCCDDEHCKMFTNAGFCEDGTCRVKSVFENDVAERPPRGFGDKCVSTLQCVQVLQVGGECWNGICQCRLKYHYNSTYSLACIRDRSIGEICEAEMYQCYQWENSFDENVMYCAEDHRCGCVKDWTAVDDEYCEYSSASNVGIRLMSIAMAIVLAKTL